MTGPTPQERAERVLRHVWQACVQSPLAGDPFQWQAAALQRAELLASDIVDGQRDTAVVEALRELRLLTTCRCEQAWTGRGLHAPDCLEAWQADVETLAAAVEERTGATP